MFFNCVDWMCEHVHQRDGYCIWEYAYPSFYGTRIGWKSAHAQAEGMQLLLRAHALTKNDKYSQIVTQALHAFEVPFEEGGLRMTMSQDAWWYLKFADENSMHRPKVLNGMMFALLGIQELCGSGDALAIDLFHRGMRALMQCLDRFDSGNWSYYDEAGKPASMHYHGIHIEQLRRLYEYTREAPLKAYAERFAVYLARRGGHADRIPAGIVAEGDSAGRRQS